ncbi:DnaJ domain-containing protein [Legionella brunensis]|uniref:Multifunctional virulence effector protein DrrA n=1 Tax=Legionella brunensis TaxID=29422 RepID=A0A0W0SPB5_9GAMM|nr:DnaJ domain-containing protein [Legionella brunensis]KTC85140.1 multifunctional virulence effector protein DrrA [Legionella brunensis]
MARKKVEKQTVSNNFDGLLELLDVEELTADNLKKSYKNAAAKWHPDKNPNDPEAGAKFDILRKNYALLLPLAETKNGKISPLEEIAIAEKMAVSSVKANNTILNMIAGVSQDLADAIKGLVTDMLTKLNLEAVTGLHYEYARVDIDGGRQHSRQVDVSTAGLTEEQQQKLHPSLQGLKGDVLKTKILANFKDSFRLAQNQEDVDRIVKEFKAGPEYKILKTGQDMATRFFHLKTSSAIAVEDIVKEVEADLASKKAAAPNN